DLHHHATYLRETDGDGIAARRSDPGYGFAHVFPIDEACGSLWPTVRVPSRRQRRIEGPPAVSRHFVIQVHVLVGCTLISVSLHLGRRIVAVQTTRAEVLEEGGHHGIRRFQVPGSP